MTTTRGYLWNFKMVAILGAFAWGCSSSGSGPTRRRCRRPGERRGRGDDGERWNDRRRGERGHGWKRGHDGGGGDVRRRRRGEAAPGRGPRARPGTAARRGRCRRRLDRRQRRRRRGDDVRSHERRVHGQDRTDHRFPAASKFPTANTCAGADTSPDLSWVRSAGRGQELRYRFEGSHQQLNALGDLGHSDVGDGPHRSLAQGVQC